MMRHFQIAIIGGGVIGSSIARELSRFDVAAVVFEKGSDVASGTSKANSGVIHSGINSPNSSKKAYYCVKGNEMFRTISSELQIPIKWPGKFVVAQNEAEIGDLEKLLKTGEKNGVKNLSIVDGDIVKRQEPNVSCYAALWVPTAGIVSPYKFTIALAEHAAINGVKFLLESKVIDIKSQNGSFIIKTTKSEYTAEVIINASGINCKVIVTMLETPDFQVYPCRGEYLVLDKRYEKLVTSMIYPVPIKELGVLGVHITPTVEGNIILGPSAEFIDSLDDTRTTRETMKKLLDEAIQIIPNLPTKSVISAYSGLRCKLAPPSSGGWADFRIEESKINPGFYNLLGIESPGLTAAPAIAKELAYQIIVRLELKEKTNFKPIIPTQKSLLEFTDSEQQSLIKKDPRWGKIVCRCEHVTEYEVLNALNNPIEATTLSSVKYRCRAGSGRCQGGFCTQHIVKLINKELGIPIENIKLKSKDSKMFHGPTRRDNDDK